MISFEPRAGKAQTGQTSGGFAVIIPIKFKILSVGNITDLTQLVRNLGCRVSYQPITFLR